MLLILLWCFLIKNCSISLIKEKILVLKETSFLRSIKTNSCCLFFLEKKERLLLIKPYLEKSNSVLMVFEIESIVKLE